MENNKRKWDFQSITMAVIALVGSIALIYEFCKPAELFKTCQGQKFELVPNKYYLKEVEDSEGKITTYKVFINQYDEEYIELKLSKKYTTIIDTCTAENAYVKYLENDVREISYAEICLPKKE